MLFNSHSFFIFFAVVCLLYYLVAFQYRIQNGLLLIASYFFYGYWDYRFLALIITSTLVDYLAGIKIEHAHQTSNRANAKLWLYISVLTNLGILGFFKYFNFFTESISQLLNTAGLNISPLTLSITLPVGISFYTFQTMSYSIDVYNKKQKPVLNLLDFSLFVAFFPQLMAGPIERAKKLLPQIQSPRKTDVKFIRYGIWLILWGLFKKVCIADNLAAYHTWGLTMNGEHSSLGLYALLLNFSIRIYCDFSGYSDMARGIARMLGFDLSLNFNLPYFAPNPAELWRRWHITMAQWFRDYVFIPIGVKGNEFRISLSFLLTMLLMGLWHGADWNYICWGGSWGVVLVIYRYFHKRTKYRLFSLNEGLGIFLTHHIWLLLFMIFVTPSVKQAFSRILIILTNFSISYHAWDDLLGILLYAWPLLVIQCIQYIYKDIHIMKKMNTSISITVYMGILCFLLFNGAALDQEFIYFQF